MSDHSVGDRLGKFIVAALLTAFSGSLVGSFIVMLATIVTYPGDGGVTVALWALAPMTVVGAIIAFLTGLPILVVLGLPLTVPFEAWITTSYKKALMVGTATGAVFGALAGAFLFGDKTSLVAAVLCGSIYGLAWIFFYRHIVIVPAFEGAHNG